MLVAFLPVQDAFADRTRQIERKQPPSKARAAPPIAPSAALSLTGTYALTSVAMRPVRDVELAKSRMTFSNNGDVAVQTACNRMGTTLQARAKPGQILGFSNPVHQLLPCQGRASQAETTTARLLVETANIARTGDMVTFFSTTGVNIAQWTAVAASKMPEVSAPQRGAPAPVRDEFGDYVLSELNGNPVGSIRSNSAISSARPRETPEAAPTNSPSNMQITSGVPNLFLRGNGSVMGGSGCNQYSAILVNNGDGTRRFGPVTSSKKACLDRRTRNLEAQLFTTLRTAVRVEVAARRIDLYAPNGSRSARFSAIGARASASPSLYGTKWNLRQLNGTAITGPNPPSISFQNNQATGSTGCNQFSLQHDRQNGRSRFSNGIMTEMACMANGRNELERRFMDAVQASTSIEISAIALTLRSPDGRTVLIFEAE